MLPIIEGATKSYIAVKTDGGRKKYAMSYSFHLDTGDLAHKAGVRIQHAAEKGYSELSRVIRRKYRTMKVKKALNSMRKSLSRKISLDLPIDLRSIKSRFREAVHA